MKWVFHYKFDQDGYLIKCKARICVRGDLQDDPLDSTYAATLAAKSFRALMAICAKYDLECKQFDVVNAFLNASVNKKDGEIYCNLPDGFKDLGFSTEGIGQPVAELDKALYGLKDSPMLWYNEFSSALEALGLAKSSEEPCVFINNHCLVLFYVDDILLLYRKSDESHARELVNALKSKYELHEEGDVRWFLGIRVLRDRSRRKLWLCQDAYIEKIAAKFDLLKGTPRFPTIPIPTTKFKRNEGQADKQSVRLYQEKVGSILYAAMTVRPDVARAAAQLSRFLTNPSKEHHDAADQTILYLYSTRFLAIEYGGTYNEALVIASDASFADDEETRRSSQGYIISLYGGPIAWKSGLQDTVTTSTTEAELLAVERTTKESYSLERFFKDISLDLGMLKIYCDNQQTIRLVARENERIITRLRHVDIQNMWLKQEFKKGRFELSYLPTAEMPADGLTKALSRQQFQHFRSMLNLQDVMDLVQGSEKSE